MASWKKRQVPAWWAWEWHRLNVTAPI
jgi:hypothetical protein